jgi:hypothetical protein
VIPSKSVSPPKSQLDLFADDQAEPVAVAEAPAETAAAPDPVQEPEPELPPEPEAWTKEMAAYAETAVQGDDGFEAAEDRQDLAEAAAKSPHSDATKAMAKKVAAQNPDPVAGDLDPSSPNYRYRDTGYVAGSRKEMAASTIRRIARTGATVRVTDVDWDALEQNPREAKELIVKGNVFGAVDWNAMRDAGVDPGAGFLVSKVYGSVGTGPVADTADGRHDYSLAVTTLRDRMDACRTVDEVTSLIAEMRDERDGEILNETERGLYDRALAFYRAATEKVRAVEKQYEELHGRAVMAESQASSQRYENEKRARRKWKVDPEAIKLVDGLAEEGKVLRDVAIKFREDNGMNPIQHKSGSFQSGSMSVRFEYPYRADQDAARGAMDSVRKIARIRNAAENSMTRAWRSLGEGFNAVLDYRSGKHGSEAFARHVASVRAGRVKDWSWAEKSNEPRGASKRSVTFQLHIADHVERVGGRPVTVDSTEGLKAEFNLRDVQSGNWVLDDLNSAKFHVESCAGAFADMADILGVADGNVSFNNRLAMAFGARGKGGAKAHYEPVQRVINITKMAGAGSLAHEWFHCLDNLVKEAMTGHESGVDDFATTNPESLDHAELQSAFRDVGRAMTVGNFRKKNEMVYTEAEEKWAKHNMASTYGGRVREAIKNASGLQAAVDVVDSLYRSGAMGSLEKKKTDKLRDNWRKIAAIHHGGNEARKVSFESGPGISKFMFDAITLDQGAAGKYWSSTHEMAARAFSSYMEDKLHDAKRSNTYLVSDANNAAYRRRGEPWCPFPESEERDRTNAAFDKLFEIIRKDDVLAKAMSVFEVVDAIENT